jgi:CheY-like chemotaxis protein
MSEAPKRSRILIVDDSERMLEQAASALKAAGYDVVTTTQAVGASRHLAGCDLAIIDFHMPGYSGEDLVASMRNAMSSAARRPLIYLYSSDEDVAREYRRHGFDGCFVDKGNVAALREQVDAAFRLINMRGIAARVKRALE